jgi:hypothetical protein
MRQIIFRGKLLYSETEWIEGNLIIARDGQPYIIPFDIFEPYGHHLIINSDNPFYVKPETVSQFTGMVDKNNKLIFENDICSQEQSINGFVRFDHGWAIDYDTHSHDMPQYYCDYLEIIGNRFDNAEMLDDNC